MQLYAHSPLTASKHPVSLEDLRLLAELQTATWSPASSFTDRSQRLATLAEQGLVVCDSEDPALRRLRQLDEQLDALRWHPYAALYHFGTRESEHDTGIDTQPIPDTEALALTVGEDAANWVKQYGPPPSVRLQAPEARETVRLEVLETSGPFFDVLHRRRTVRAFDAGRSLPQADLNVLLREVYGCQGSVDLSEELTVLHKTSPSGGSLHPIEAFPLVLDVEGLEPGFYHYDALEHALRLILRLDVTAARQLAIEMGSQQTYIGAAHVVVVLVARFFRNYWKYRRRSRAYAVTLMDAAHLSQTFYLVAAELGLGAFFTAAINAARIEETLGLEPLELGAVAMSGCGLLKTEGPDLGLAFEPFSPRR